MTHPSALGWGQVTTVAFSFVPLPSKSALRLLVGHLVTDAAPVSGKELMMHKCAVAQLERAGPTSSAFLGCGVNRKLNHPAQPGSVPAVGVWDVGEGYTEPENRWCLMSCVPLQGCGWCQGRAGQ